MAQKLNDKLEIQHIEKKGKCVLASRDIKKGELVLENFPYASIVSNTYVAERCHCCFERNPKLKCGKCGHARYHSKQCQIDDWPLHKNECKWLIKMREQNLPDIIADEIFLAYRVILQRAKENSSKNTGNGINKNPIVINYADHIKNLAVHLDRAKGNKDDWNITCQLADLILATLPRAIVDQLELTFDDVTRLICQMRCNNFSIWNDLLVGVGSGVYPIGAYINHSCDPTCVITYGLETKSQMFRSIRDIRKGEEVTHSYIDLASSTPDRRKKLKEIYSFQCMCKRCVDPPDVENYYQAFIDDNNTELRAMELSVATEFFEKAIRSSENETKLFEKSYEFRCKHLHKSNLDRLASACHLLTSYLENGEFSKCIHICEYIIDTYKKIYPKHHPMIGLQKYSMGDFYNFDQKTNLALANHKEAYEILKISHGESNDLVQGLKENLK